MELIFKNETVQFGELSSVEEIIEKINELLADQYYFSHLIVDGEEIYEDPESYLLNSLESISTIEVAVKTIQEFVNEVLIMAKDYLTNAIPEMTSLADGFYQNPTSENWVDFSAMLEGMQWLNKTINVIDKAKERPANWNECIKLAAQFEMELKNLEQAVENSDNVLIADIIQYELLPVYEALLEEINTTIDTEVERYDLN
jgi:hypothetical protein